MAHVAIFKNIIKCLLGTDVKCTVCMFLYGEQLQSIVPSGAHLELSTWKASCLTQYGFY